MGRMSVATIDSPEFINITSINPLVSKCEIKVLYVGENRNRSFISKDVATQMAQTLPGSPIVGYYIENKEDFGDHGDQMIIDGEGVKFKKLTKPYGFVAPDSKIWFQKFEDTDEFGNTVVRDYLMTEGFLWTGQFEECKRVLSEGNPQSMELDEKTLKGHWSTDNNRGIDFFIINDAIFSKLCILGEDVEPCFEGAAVSAPKVSSHFTMDDDFKNTLSSMIKELKELTFSLQNKGGSSMDGVENTTVVEEQVTEEAPVTENFSVEEDKNGSEAIVENQNITEEFEKKDNEEDTEEKKEDNADSKTEDGEEDDAKEEDDEKKPNKNHSLEEEFALIKEELEELKNSYSLLQKENEALVAFKNKAEDEKKDALINSFYMLSDEDKKEVIENKSKYSLDDIEAKLSVICVRKKVSFAKEDEEVKEEQPAVTFNLNQVEVENEILPAWLKAVENKRNENI